MLRRRFAIPVFAIFLVILFGAAFALPVQGQSSGFTPTVPPIAVPDFRFEDEKGQSHDLKEFRGRIVLLNLWATWCKPCASEMPALDQLAGQLDPRKFAVIALTEDRDGVDAARGFFQRHGISRLNLYADPGGHVPFLLGAHGLPTSILIGADGLERARLEGAAEWTQPEMKAYLDQEAKR